MTEQRNSTYEGMFLFPQSASADFQGMIDHINEILGRADAEILAMKKWDERRLAYDIKGNKRGVYILTYFNADRQRVSDIERDCNLSELLLRSLVIRADHVPAEEIEVSDQRTALADEATLRKEEAKSEAAKTEAAAAAMAQTAADVAEEAKARAEAPAEATPEAAPEATPEAAPEAAPEAPAEATAEATADATAEAAPEANAAEEEDSATKA